jgi:hypothetical protein
MRAFVISLVALVLISVGANQLLMRLGPTSADAGTSVENVRLSD